MIPNPDSPEGIELGNQIAGFALANLKRWGIDDVIWRHAIYLGADKGEWMSEMGSETANHFDHVHIAPTVADTRPGTKSTTSDQRGPQKRPTRGRVQDPGQRRRYPTDFKSRQRRAGVFVDIRIPNQASGFRPYAFVGIRPCIRRVVTTW
jgi:hypothetical protein